MASGSVGLAVVAMVMVCLASTTLHAQTISSITIDGLPSGMAANDLMPALDEKAGGVFVKTQEPGDCTTITNSLIDIGYLDAAVKASTTFVPGGVRLTFTVTLRMLVTIHTVQVTGLTTSAVHMILDQCAVTGTTVCTQAICQKLSVAVADTLGMNVLFLGMDRKLSADKHEVTVIFSK